MRKARDTIGSYMFLFPAGAIYLSVIVFPVFYSTYISLFRWNGIGSMIFLGFDNYTNLFSDIIFIKSLSNTLIWTVLTLFLTMTVALGLAILLNKQFRGRTFFRGLYFFPTVLALIAVSVIWRWIYNPGFGFINEFFKLIGSDYRQGWISDPNASLYAIFFASLWRSVGRPMIFFLAGLQTVPVELLEAAIIDGATNTRRFFSVTIPLMKETFIIVIATLTVDALKTFDIIWGLTGGVPNNATEMLSTYMYSHTFRFANVGYGTAISVLMVVFMLIVIVPFVSFTAGKD